MRSSKRRKSSAIGYKVRAEKSRAESGEALLREPAAGWGSLVALVRAVHDSTPALGPQIGFNAVFLELVIEPEWLRDVRGGDDLLRPLQVSSQAGLGLVVLCR